MRYTMHTAAAICTVVSQAFAQQLPAAKPPAAAAPADTLRIISDFKTPPFSYQEVGEKVGVDIDLGEALAKEMGKRVEWVTLGFDIPAYAAALDRGKADAAISAISITEERLKSVSFTKPYARMDLALAVRSDIDWRHHWFTTGMKDWRILVMRGTTAEKWARDNLEGRIEYHSSLDRMVQVLKGSKMPTESGKGGTCILFDEVPLRWALSQYSYRYEIVETGMESQKYGVAVRKGNAALLESLNAALARLKAGGKAAAIREKWRTRAQGLDFFQDE